MRGLPPLSYNLRSLFVRWPSTLLTVASIGATVAVIAGVLALEQGFSRLYQLGGRDDVLVFLRKGALAEGESVFPRERADILVKETPEVAIGEDDQPLAGAEVYLAVRQRKLDGGETNVPIRGVEPASFRIAGDRLRITQGRNLKPGNDEVIVGEALVGRIRNCELGQTITINTTPFKVVGVFAYDGPFRSEVWGDLDRMSQALQRPQPSRVVARMKPGTDVAALRARLDGERRVNCQVMTETTYLEKQTKMLSGILWGLGIFLGGIMGTAAVFTGTNTMLAAISARTHEIGVLVALGFRPGAVFLSFLFEALLLGVLGGVAGCLMVLPIHDIRTGTTNFQTFTEVAFAFQVTPTVLGIAVASAMFLGLVGGLWPAWKAANSDPVEALRHG
jgi:putative ABC transport system permease protein